MTGLGGLGYCFGRGTSMKLGDSGLIARREGAVEKRRRDCRRATQRLHMSGIAMGDNAMINASCCFLAATDCSVGAPIPPHVMLH